MLKPLAVISGIAGALLVSIGRPSLMLPALALLIASSLVWAYVGYRQREWSLSVLSLAYIAIDMVGMWRWSMTRN